MHTKSVRAFLQLAAVFHSTCCSAVCFGVVLLAEVCFLRGRHYAYVCWSLRDTTVYSRVCLLAQAAGASVSCASTGGWRPFSRGCSVCCGAVALLFIP